MAAITCAIEYLRSEARPALILSGFCCGALAGTKISGLAGLGCVLLIVLSRRPLRFDKARIRLVISSLLLPALALAVPWLIKSALYTGRPVYPLLFQRLGGVEWNATLGEQFMAWQQGMGMGDRCTLISLYPFRVVMDPGTVTSTGISVDFGSCWCRFRSRRPSSLDRSDPTCWPWAGTSYSGRSRRSRCVS